MKTPTGQRSSSRPRLLGDALPTGGADRRRVAGRSFIGPRQEPKHKPTKAEIAAAREKVIADLEMTRDAERAGIPVEDMYPEYEQMELIPPDEQDLPDCRIKEVGLPDPRTLWYSAASED